MSLGDESVVIAFQLILNGRFGQIDLESLFTPIQFGLKNNLLATADILLLLGTLIWATVAIFPYVRWVSYIQTPYLLWVSFATVLQITVTYLNR